MVEDIHETLKDLLGGTIKEMMEAEKDALMASLQEILKLNDEQLTAFTVYFEARLQRYKSLFG